MSASVLNPFSTLKTDPVRNFRFLVEFLPLGNADKRGFKPKALLGFVNVSGLAVATDSIAYREGGYNTTVHQIPGQTQFQPITFARGALLGTDQHQKWMKELFATISGTADRGVGTNFRCNIDISVLSHPNPAEWKGSGGAEATDATELHTSMRFRVYNAWISGLQYGDLSAGANDFVIETLSVVHEGWDLTWATGYAGDNGAPKFSATGAPEQ